MSRLPRPTRRGWCLLTAGIALVIAGAGAGFADLIRAGVFALILVALAAALAMTRPQRLSVRRTLPERLRTGRTDSVAVSVEAPRTTWTGVTLRESHSFGGKSSPRWSFDRLPRGESTLTYEITPPHRGEFTTGPLTMEITDPLRLVHGDSRHGQQETWLVWPEIHDVDGDGGRRRGDGEDELISAHASQSGHAGASIREYAQGDDMRTVHWPATAHRGELMVRQFDPPAQPMTRLLVHGDVPELGTQPSWERLVSLAASACVQFGRHAIPLSVSVGSRHVESVREALDALAAVTTSLPDGLDLPPAPTLLFHHTSAPVTLTAARHLPSMAVVSGPGAAAAARQLQDLGWEVEVLTDDAQPADVLTSVLSSFGAAR